MSICTTNRVRNIPQKNQLLADAIPAESYATGRNPIQKFLNFDMQSMQSSPLQKPWTHSFIMEAPYAWTYRVYNSIKEGTKQ